jgi:hypothetical protein
VWEWFVSASARNLQISRPMTQENVKAVVENFGKSKFNPLKLSGEYNCILYLWVLYDSQNYYSLKQHQQVDLCNAEVLCFL